MPTSTLIDELMLRWEDARRQGKKPTPEELCADCPEHVDEVRRRIRSVLTMENILGLTDHDPHKTVLEALAHGPDTPLPTIPGYEIVRVIDQGGMGVVYEAKQLALGRIVAIKMIAGHPRAKVVERFKSEAESAARLQHANFVQIFEVGAVNGRPFFSMEYVAGGSLAERMKDGPLPPREAAALIETLARAVHAAHERGVVHRDLKPSNVLLKQEHGSVTPKIADFGLAKRLDDDSDHTRTGEVLGTPAYMAPEQAEGKKDAISPATDTYALGAILYEMLAGRPPFQGTSPLDALRQVVNFEPIAPSQVVAATPRDLEAICLKCLEKAPTQRYASGLALAEDLRRFLDGQPVTARRIGPVQRMWRTVRRHPQAIALAVAISILVLIPVGLLVGNYRNEQRIREKAVANAPLVREILQRNCLDCHGPDYAEKDLSILDYRELLDSERRIVVPGDPDHSRLIKRIADGSMPPEDQEEHLPRVSELELTILREWILGGAPPLPDEDPQNPTPSVVPFSPLAKQAKAILHERCYKCHKYSKADGGIKIMNHRLLVTLNKVVVPGDPERSDLYLLLKAPDKSRMPKPPVPRLPQREIEIIRQWIEEGALPFPKD